MNLRDYKGFILFVSIFLMTVASFATMFTMKLVSGFAMQRDRELKVFVFQLMDISGAQLSPSKKEVTADAIVKVANRMFTTVEQREQFLVLIAIESAFNPDATSKAGATGLTQIMPKFAKEFNDYCGLPTINPEKDLKNTEINLLVGACAFRTLIEKYHGRVTPALVAYNAGAGSTSIKQLFSGVNITNPESSTYSVKFHFVYERAQEARKTLLAMKDG